MVGEPRRISPSFRSRAERRQHLPVQDHEAVWRDFPQHRISHQFVAKGQPATFAPQHAHRETFIDG
jgi:hypothetical protein